MNKYKNIAMALLLLLTAACADDQVKEDGMLGEAPEGDGTTSGINPYWSWVGSFPGWISASAIREELTPVEINGVYEKQDQTNRIGFYSSTPWVSTGFYAAPGETVTIVKPAGMNGKVKWRIGAWNCILPETATLKRYSKVYEEGEISGDTTKAMSYFGGNVYIVPEDPFVKPETFLIGGAIKSPDFVSGKTDVSTWKEAIKNTKVPFAELIGKKCIWTMPVSTLATIQNPQALLDFYDDIITNDFETLHGFSTTATDKLEKALTFPVRVVEDLQLCNGQSHAGYPIMLDMSDTKIGTDFDDMRSSNVALKFYKELGSTYQTWCWTWLGVKEVVNLLPYYHSRSRQLRNWPATETTDWDLVVSEFVKRTSADKDFEMGNTGIGEFINKANARVIPFVQLAQKYGWKLYSYLGECSRNLSSQDALVLKIMSTQGRRDFFCKKVCEYANANLIPFFDAWGIAYSSVAAVDMKKLPTYEGDKFWERWDISVIPDFNVEQTPSSIKLPDDNYNNVVAQLDQTKWKVDSASGKALEGKPEHVINGKWGKDDKNNYHWVSESVSKRPFYTPQPWLALDMSMAYTVSEVYVVLRNNKNNARFQPKLIDVYTKLNPEDEWQYWGQAETQNLAGVWQKAKMEAAPVSARYIKIQFMQGHGTGNDSGGVSFDEFTLGGTLYISDDTEITGGDSDFPNWN